jgi:ssDNA-binding Zn-finger/Zn-ribbon topoisomerase 1
MSMKLIDLYQENLIICDNPKCDYLIPNPTGDPNAECKQYINMPCPKCGQNLLTEADYNQSNSFMRKINFINKWFGWLSVITGTSSIISGRQERRIKASVHFHNGANVEIKTGTNKSK